MIRYLQTPEQSFPMNAQGGLYAEILCDTGPADKGEALQFVYADVAAAGYNPEGRAEMGPPCQHGIVSCSHSMWFYERVKP